MVLLWILFLAGLLLALRFYGASRHARRTADLRKRLEAARAPVKAPHVDFAELDGLPLSVQRYFRTVLKDGQTVVAAARVRHQGTFNMGDGRNRWRPFSSDQRVITQRPGFDWSARIAMLPGVPVYVHDAYVAGHGLLHASVLGLFTVANIDGGGAIAEGELMRFLAEAAWYPTALLPSQGVRWEAVDESSARATLADGDVGVSLLFTFNEQGLIDTVSASARGRTVGDRIVPTPWQGRFWNYAEHCGMLVPLAGEVAWLLMEELAPYWRGEVKTLEYEFAR